MNKFTGLFEKALLFAIEKHKNQKRKNSNIPYYWHVMCVAKNVEDNKKSVNLEMILTAAVLHDTVEDCDDVTLQMIADTFGYQVAALVEELTSDEKEIERLGKTEYLKIKMEKMSSYALVIKLSDRLDNVKDLSTTDQKFRERYTKQTSAIIEHLKSCGRKLTATHNRIIEKIERTLIEQNEISLI